MSRLLVSQVAALTRQLGRVSLVHQASTPTAATLADTTALFRGSLTQLRFFASPRKGPGTKKKKPKGPPEKKKKATGKAKKAPVADEPPPPQHQQWVQFQQSIAVQGFETGQTVTHQTPTRKKRGGRVGRTSHSVALEAKLAERQRMTAFGGGEYPPERYSDEETERLLAEAYTAIPPRAGKRGTRNLRRQKVRWHLVRKARKKYKRQLVQHHERKMEIRSLKIKDVKQVIADAPAMVKRDREYQAQMYRRWAAIMVQDQEQSSSAAGA